MSDRATADRRVAHMHGRAPFADHPDRACATEDWRMFFPDEDRSSRPAREVCRRCPFINDCREWAVAHNEAGGVWGATTPSEREAIRRRRTKRARERVAA
jgi:WhiB family redox-sensing transcriptional regulator